MPGSVKRSIRPEDIYLLKTVFDPQLSPDGKRVAYTISWSDEESDQTQMAIEVAPADGRGKPRRFTQGKHDHSPRWSPDGRHLAFVSNRGERSQLFVGPLDGGEPRRLTKAKFGVAQPAWSPDGRRIAYLTHTGEYKEGKERNAAERNAPRVIRDLRHKLDGVGFFDERRVHVLVVDADTGESRQVTDGDWHDDQPAWSPDGKWIAFVSDRERARHQRHLHSDLWLVPSAGGRSRKLTRSRGRAGSPAFSPDGRQIAFVGGEDGNAVWAKNMQLLVVPTTGGGPPRSISSALDRSVVGGLGTAGRTFAWSRDGQSLLFLAGDRGAISLYRAGLANGSASKVLGGDRAIDGFDLAPDGRRAVFSASWITSPSEIYTATLSGRGPERTISRANDALRSSVQLGRVRRMTYRASDGLAIEAFVLYPTHYRPGRRYPTVLEIHGGPHGAHPSPLSLLPFQSLAAAGYVVLMPNPRGSGTYGEAFTEGCVRDWGGKDYDDIMAGVDALIRRGVADPDQLYVAGYSYGGYMTSWAVGHTDRFRAAAVGAPVADLISGFGEGDMPQFDLYELGGPPWDRPDGYRERSSTSYLPNVKTPVLLLHWEGDLRCPIGQSEEIFTGLKLLGKEVEFMRYPGGSHVVRAPSQALDMNRSTMAWFNDHAPKARAARNGRAAVTPRTVTRRNGARPTRAKVTA
ncbi:MAG: S9 family peptidase [Dehalococcoidia bacterium]